jgi:hypothetical protein
MVVTAVAGEREAAVMRPARRSSVGVAGGPCGSVASARESAYTVARWAGVTERAGERKVALMKLAHEESRKRRDDGGAPCRSAAWAGEGAYTVAQRGGATARA